MLTQYYRYVSLCVYTYTQLRGTCLKVEDTNKLCLCRKPDHAGAIHDKCGELVHGDVIVLRDTEQFEESAW